mmetsp:Transcript_12280/g.16852  ORF Transcript_12280/g.16852 Transcript_12280/m.16852 type:complete len:179 (-) Transcript_12280:1098-1634(-)|eukprot:CAMPEP_0170117034 /NCGR_PEP_ID=MMETSP0020_2-20130122/12709_1 /TAXON_ID=98059 /ORGANISM="Dinobryon sp., Strain UTEXLB2267" /LENGTH=178 /DNA_ID=CAMNT_0010345435 /DNA_START=48 /DNA_END=584 /DNA_ORIENTATION=+
MKSDCQLVLDVLNKKGINFLAIDFDLTLISEHTGGRYSGNSKELSKLIRPCFSDLIPFLLDGGIQVAVVTFSCQTPLIKEAIKIGFPTHWQKIVIRACDNTWGDMGEKMKHGKQKYIASAAEETECQFKVEISRSTTLLIDDDAHNIRIALRNQVQALLFLPHNPTSLFSDINELGIH